MNNTPKLRFSEFSGEWNNKKLGNLGTFFKGSGLSKAHLSEEGKPCVLYGELYTRYGEVIKNVVSRTDFEDAKLVIGQVNDVLIPSSGESAIDIATASCLQQDEVILGGDLNVFRSDEVNGVFVSYQLNNSKRNEIAKLAQGASVVHVYNNQLSKLKLSVPCREEQEKIASFCYLIDKKIELQTEKVESLKEYKRGMMQKMFPKNGKTIPEIRFEGFSGDWKQYKLGEIFYKVNERNDGSFGKEHWISVAKMYFQDPEKVQSNNIDTRTYVMRFGDIAFEGNKSKSFKYGRFVANDIGDGVVSELFPIYRHKNSYSNDFWKRAIQLDSIMAPIFSKSITSSGVSSNKLDEKHFLRQGILVPNIEEQHKIGEYFKSLDNLISLHQCKLDELNEYKKGLLQQMFV